MFKLYHLRTTVYIYTCTLPTNEISDLRTSSTCLISSEFRITIIPQQITSIYTRRSNIRQPRTTLLLRIVFFNLYLPTNAKVMVDNTCLQYSNQLPTQLILIPHSIKPLKLDHLQRLHNYTRCTTIIFNLNNRNISLSTTNLRFTHHTHSPKPYLL